MSDSTASTTPSTDWETWNWRDSLSTEERRELLQVDNLHGAVSIALNWGLVFGAMALVAWAPNPLTIVLALFVIGARQLGFAILMHEAAHRSLFGNRALNDWAGNWLAAYPIWAEVEPYRRYHLVHHAHTGTANDPDLGLITPFPITRESFRRKVIRDLSGQTGLKQAQAVFLRDLGWGAGRSQRDQGMSRGERPDVGWRKLAPVVLTNALLFAVLALAGHPWLYLLWVVAWLTTYRLVTRIRSIAEHALTPNANDALNNTRTTLASWWERLLIAPNRVNYHLEHHLMMTVPHYKLPRFHRLLRERGVLDQACVAQGYAGILRTAASRAA
jgi:fatty acid desaturase